MDPDQPHLPSSTSQELLFTNIPPGTSWNKILCQTPITADPSGRLCRRLLSITAVDPPTPPDPIQPNTISPSASNDPPSASDQQQLKLTSPLPTSYTIYVDGGWDSTDTDFYSAFQEQLDPINRRGSAGIAIVPNGTDWQQQGTTIITLTDGIQIGSQPAHMELAAIIVGLVLRRWYLPPQQDDIIYLDCKSITDVFNSTAPRSPNSQPNSHSCRPYFTTPKLSRHREPPWTGPRRIQNNVPPSTTTRTGTGAFYSQTAQPPIIRSHTKSRSINISNFLYRKSSKCP